MGSASTPRPAPSGRATLCTPLSMAPCPGTRGPGLELGLGYLARLPPFVEYVNHESPMREWAGFGSRLPNILSGIGDK
jgi:hypothetical protein